MNLNEQVNTIESRADFVLFVRNLLNDLKEKPGKWENSDLPSFLEAIAAWAEDMDSYYENRGEKLTEYVGWKTFGQVLLAGKFYE